MPFERPLNQQARIDGPACAHMRSKAMIVTGQANTDHPDAVDGAYCWCNRTQHVIGPDRQEVDPIQCVPQRRCFEPAG